MNLRDSILLEINQWMILKKKLEAIDAKITQINGHIEQDAWYKDVYSRDLDDLQSDRTNATRELRELCASEAEKFTKDPLYLSQFKTVLSSEIENEHRKELSQEYKDADRGVSQSRQATLTSKLAELEPYEKERHKILAADNILQPIIAKEWDALQRLVNDFVTDLKNDTRKLLQSLSIRDLTLLQQKTNAVKPDKEENIIIIKKEGKEFSINCVNLSGQHNSNQELVLFTQLQRMLFMSALLHNPILTFQERLKAIKKNLDWIAKSAIVAHPSITESNTAEEKARLEAGTAGTKFLNKLDPMLADFISALDELRRDVIIEKLDSNVRQACGELSGHLLPKVRAAFLASSIQPETLQLWSNASNLQNNHGQMFSVSVTANPGVHFDIDLSVVNNPENLKLIPMEYHYLLNKGAQLSGLLNSPDLDGMMKKIDDVTFRKVITQHSNALRNIFSSFSASTDFLKKLDVMKLQHQKMLPIINYSDALVAPAQGASPAVGAAASAAAAAESPRRSGSLG
jgi:hypothetical protein